ncbi:MAG: hypothetical protein A3H70_00460 [Candidatus Komeilibacteria bacterium RIFCSPLOWO2_02_FULL_48_11]|uniref:DUF5666 domain-containing protein n=1 Tax=Candidatus Komeilibacteria bacterium RIFCSPLOWO2_02_FULL_48_11 TaxID=1798553 RepID=A0A1G2BRT9_9BACT|nr:MAG: hypothetical protein A3H70_00460 [Candidatus Komeilibacteria bacterium RIFCSPLOWO2_02_FULL_48_11]
MPKKQNFRTGQGLASRQALIVLGATLLAAIIIIVVFAFLIERDNQASNQNYQNYVNQLKNQQNAPPAQTSTTEPEIPRQIVRGVLTVINPETISVATEGANQKIEISLRPETTITYQNKAFDRSRFYIGDQLEITARPAAGTLVAETITVLVSASPATPAPLPPVTPQNIQPDGSIKPL